MPATPVAQTSVHNGGICQLMTGVMHTAGRGLVVAYADGGNGGELEGRGWMEGEEGVEEIRGCGMLCREVNLIIIAAILIM